MKFFRILHINRIEHNLEIVMKMQKAILITVVLLLFICIFTYSLWYQWIENQSTAHERMKPHRPIAEFDYGSSITALTISTREPYYIVSAGEENKIKVWLRDNPVNPIKVLNQHPRYDTNPSIHSLFVNKSGQWLISRSSSFLAFWNLDTLEMESYYEITSSRCTVSPCEELLALGSVDLKFWDISDPKKIKESYTLSDKDSDNLYMSTKFSYDGRWLAKGIMLQDHTSNERVEKVKIWDLKTKQVHKILKRLYTKSDKGSDTSIISQFNKQIITSITFSPDNRFFVIGTNFGFTIWTLPEWKIYHNVDNVYIMDFAFSPNRKVFASASINGIMIWSIDEMKPIALLKENREFTIYKDIMFTSDGKSLVCAVNTLVGDKAGGRIYLWEMEGIE